MESSVNWPLGKVIGLSHHPQRTRTEYLGHKLKLRGPRAVQDWPLGWGTSG